MGQQGADWAEGSNKGAILLCAGAADSWSGVSSGTCPSAASSPRLERVLRDGVGSFLAALGGSGKPI